MKGSSKSKKETTAFKSNVKKGISDARLSKFDNPLAYSIRQGAMLSGSIGAMVGLAIFGDTKEDKRSEYEGAIAYAKKRNPKR